jgi:multicomponent Na+:H+ antiporter subunit F
MIYVAGGLIMAGLLFSVFRLIKGKELENRIVAMEIITTIVTGILVLLSHVYDNALLLDVALVYAILSFTAVVAAARYLEGGI